jgi:hypothetical protein
MGVLLACLEATDHTSEFITEVELALDRIAQQRPDLVERYDEAFMKRSAADIETLLMICDRLLSSEDDIWIGNLRVNAVTRRFHVGNGNRSAPLFPPAS